MCLKWIFFLLILFWQGHKHFDFIPASYVLPGDYQDFCCEYKHVHGWFRIL